MSAGRLLPVDPQRTPVRWTWSPAWRATADGDRVVLSAGGDHVYEVGGIDPALARAVARCEAEPEATIATLPGPLLDRLVGLGAVVATPPPGPLQVAVVPLATADEGAAAALATALDTLALERVTVVGPDEASTLVWVRAATPLGAGLEAARPPGLPVLLVDLAYHDVVSVGPWWVPPATACPWCYLGRLRHRWGDHPVPAQAAVTRWPVVAAGLVGVQLEAIAARRSTLTNAAISWDLRHGGSDRQVVLKVPWCPMCEEAA